VDLYRMPADGGAMVNLTPRSTCSPGAPVASPDGQSIYFEAGIGGSTHRFRVPVRGGEVQQVTKGERRLGDFVADPHLRRIVYSGATSDRPVELYIANADGSAERRLTGFNDSLVAETAPVAARRLAFKSADGTPVEGWLLLPKSYSASGPAVPMILAMHGGPTAPMATTSRTNSSSGPRKWICRPVRQSPRLHRVRREVPLRYLGRLGRARLSGRDGRRGSRLAGFRIDPKRLGVTGYSYGGFLTDWVITQTPRFAAAIAGAGISNWISDYGTADIPRTKESEVFRSALGGEGRGSAATALTDHVRG
jgi:dipeptidyl aminopeptidase/acylaminoacyl peptidase